MKKSDVITILVLILVLLITGAVTWYLKSNATTVTEVTSAADVALGTAEGQSSYTTLDGDLVDLVDYRGDVLVVNSWASWCPFCVNELPHFEELAEIYKEQGVTVLAINRKERQNIARSYLDSVGGFDDVLFLLDPDDRFYSSIGGITMPETIFYDAAGNVVVHKRGFMDLNEMRFHVDQALAASE